MSTLPTLEPITTPVRTLRPSVARECVLTVKRYRLGLSEEEARELDLLMRANEQEVLSEEDVDRMAEQDAEGRLFATHTNPHD